MTKLILVSLISLALIIPATAQAQILINEIAWMGTIVSTSDEWLELYNTENQDVSLDGWLLEAQDGSPVINLSGAIPANGYFLLERTDDETVPQIPADLIFSGSIGNIGEYFQLFNSSGNLIDEAPFTTAWPGGDNTTKQTLERSSINSWTTSLQAGGTPKAKNSTALEEPPQEPQPPEEPPVPECPPIPECPVIPECPQVPECPQIPECPAVPECPTIPECPQVPECPPVIECPQIPDLNTVIAVSADQIPNLIDGQKIKIQGIITKRPMLLLGHLLAIDNLKILVLDQKPPRLHLKSQVEVVGRLLQTPFGPFLLVYQADDITAN